jgi:hypothetical protein
MMTERDDVKAGLACCGDHMLLHEPTTSGGTGVVAASDSGLTPAVAYSMLD